MVLEIILLNVLNHLFHQLLVFASHNHFLRNSIPNILFVLELYHRNITLSRGKNKKIASFLKRRFRNCFMMSKRWADQKMFSCIPICFALLFFSFLYCNVFFHIAGKHDIPIIPKAILAITIICFKTYSPFSIPNNTNFLTYWSTSC